MARAAIRWHKQGKGVVSAVSPGSPVRLWIDGPADADTKVEVFQIAERAIARALRKLFRSPGAYVTNLPIDPAVAVPSGEGVLSTEWRARQALQTAGVDPEVELRVLTFDAPELAST